MPFTTAERAAMIERYAHGPTLLKRALAKVPPRRPQVEARSRKVVGA